MLTTDSSPERVLYRKGYRYVAGVDEAGRGPLAGPVVAAAVVFPPDLPLPGVNDSQATEVIKYLVGIGKLLTTRLLIYDGLKIAFSEFIINKNPNCDHCGSYVRKE